MEFCSNAFSHYYHVKIKHLRKVDINKEKQGVSAGTLVAKPFHNEINAFQQKSLGKLHLRNRNTLHTKCFVATVAGKVHMQIAQCTHTIVVAHGVLHRAGSIVDTVNKELFVKQSDGTKQRRFIYRFEHIL